MHAIKKIASQNNVDSDDVSDEIESTKVKMQDAYAKMAGKDIVLSGLFRMSSLLGVGSFGMVIEAVAVKNITVGDLMKAQESKIKDEPAMKIGLRKFEQRSSITSQNNIKDIQTSTSSGSSTTTSTNCNKSIILLRDTPVAIKFEFNIEKRRQRFQLIKEYNVLVDLFNHYSSDLSGFAQPYLFGSLGSSKFNETVKMEKHQYYSYHFMVMERLGESVRNFFDKTSDQTQERKFPMEVTFSIAQQLITRLMFLHSAPISMTHNDLKMDQLMLGFGEKSNILYLVDFGLSMKYLDGISEKWGNRRYASRYRQHGISSPLTDLESASYVIARFMYNEFPWDNLNVNMSDSSKRWKISSTKFLLWSHVERTRKGKCKKDKETPPWLVEFFTRRNNSLGNGSKQLMMFMSKLSEYMQRDPQMSAESIDYHQLFNYFHSNNPFNLSSIRSVGNRENNNTKRGSLINRNRK